MHKTAFAVLLSLAACATETSRVVDPTSVMLDASAVRDASAARDASAVRDREVGQRVDGATPDALAPDRGQSSHDADHEVKGSAEFDPIALEKAMADERLMDHAEDVKGKPRTSQAALLLALANHYEPGLVVGGARVRDRVKAHIESLLAPGKEPSLTGGHHNWHAPTAGAVLVIARTSDVWAQLSDETRLRADWLMRGFAIVGNWYNNPENSGSAVDPDMRPGGHHLPNQRSDVHMLLQAMLYFGGPEQINAIYEAFDVDTYVERFKAFGWTNAQRSWSHERLAGLMTSGGEAVSAKDGSVWRINPRGVRAPMTGFISKRVSDPECGKRDKTERLPFTAEAIFAAESAWMWGNRVVDKACQGEGRLKDGHTSKYLGQLGMGYELNTSEGRSSPHYVRFGWQQQIASYASIVVVSGWGSQANQQALSKQMWVGANHFLGEVTKHGWWDCHNNTCDWARFNDSGLEIRADTEPDVNGLYFTKAIWLALFQ